MLNVDNVAFSYRHGARVLDGVSFRASEGKITVVLGPNGSGKSTLLRLAAGLLLPEDGTVRIDSRDTRSLNRTEAAKLAALSAADPFADAPLSVGQVLLDAGFARSGGFFSESAELRRRVHEVSGWFELDALLERGLRELSSGERNRLSVARAVVQDSRLMLLDEPSGRLDYSHRERLVLRLGKLAAEGKALVLVEHNLDVASRLADEVLALKEGRVAAYGPASDVLTPSALQEVYGVNFLVAEVNGERILFPRGVSAPAGSDKLTDDEGKGM